MNRTKFMAERQGFEPWIPFRVYTLSKRAPSATRPSLRREKHLAETPEPQRRPIVTYCKAREVWRQGVAGPSLGNTERA